MKQKKSEKKKNLWSKEEHQLFLEALDLYGKRGILNHKIYLI